MSAIPVLKPANTLPNIIGCRFGNFVNGRNLRPPGGKQNMPANNMRIVVLPANNYECTSDNTNSSESRDNDRLNVTIWEETIQKSAECHFELLAVRLSSSVH